MKLANAYVAVFVLALACMGAMIAFAPGRFELAGILIVLLSLPWSLVLVGAIMAVHSSSAWLIALACLLGCAVNWWLLRWFDKRRVRKH